MKLTFLLLNSPTYPPVHCPLTFLSSGSNPKRAPFKHPTSRPQIFSMITILLEYGTNSFIRFQLRVPLLTQWYKLCTLFLIRYYFKIKKSFCAWIFGFLIVYNLRQLPGKTKIGTAHAKYAAIQKLLHWMLHAIECSFQ